jgi:hypothetical protein
MSLEKALEQAKRDEKFLEISAQELAKAKKELVEATQNQDWLALSRTIGQPIDPRQDVADAIPLIADVETPAPPEEHLFYFQVDEDTKYVYTLASGGTATKIDVTPNSESSVSFTGINSAVYKIHIVDLNSARFNVIAKKKLAITRAMNNRELHDVLAVAWAGTPAGNQFTLDSDDTYLNFPKVLEMLNVISPYGDRYVLITGSTVDDDIILTDYRENKRQSVLEMLEKLNITRVKITGTYNDGSSHNIFESTYALLIATNTVVGKPLSFGRKQLVPNAVLEGTLDAKLRYMTVVPAIPENGEKPSVKIWGYGEFQSVLKNPKAIARFTRS